MSDENALSTFKQKVQKIIKADHVGHAYIIEAHDSELAFNAGVYFANELLKSGGGVESDNVIRVSGDGKNSNIKVEKIDDLKNRLLKRPLSGKYMIALIEGADKMNSQSQNKLLKVLEEPIIGTVVILTTNLSEALLPTIKSRCGFIKSGIAECGETQQLDIVYLENLTCYMDKLLRGEPYFQIKPVIEKIANKDIVKHDLIKGLEFCEMFLRNKMLDLFVLDKNISENITVTDESLNIYTNFKEPDLEDVYAKQSIIGDHIRKMEIAKNSIYRDFNRLNTIKALTLDILDRIDVEGKI
jgi:DNA polymerase III, gamma/tau subunits